MQIILKIEEFLKTLFSNIDIKDHSSIINTLEDYYSYGPYKPKVSIEEDIVTVEIDSPTIISQEADYRKAVSLSEKGKYHEAKVVLRDLIKKNPTNSEYHRILGQVLSEEGDHEEAINSLIDALRWDSRNGFALLMMGNVFAKYKRDIPTALKYFDQALKVNPNDYITLNNIGGLLMQEGKFEKAKEYFWDAISLNNEYPNTHLALAMIAEEENDLHSAFYSFIQSIKVNKNKDSLYQNSVKKAFSAAQRIIEFNEGKQIVNEYLHKLEFEGGTQIQVTEDSNIATAAKLEFAENYGRKQHVVRYKPNYPAVEHLITHELVHLDLVIEARKNDLNQLFVTTQEHKSRFLKSIDSTIKKLRKLGIEDTAISRFCSGIFDGINLQVYNTPIDLFIEEKIYNDFPELRPYQFLSWFALLEEGIKAVTNKKVIELSPKEIVSNSKIYNLVNALQFKDLYGIDLIEDFNSMIFELKQAKEFYAEFQEYKNDKEPAEEYEMVLHWAEDLRLENYFELINENEYRNKRTNIDGILESIENDPYDLETIDPYKEWEMDKFQKSHEKTGTNMAVVMFMVDALQYFEGMSKDKIQPIAFEIATLGIQGFRPDKKDYRINSIRGKVFSGYHILAYYYVSWMLALPHMVPELKLPFDEEYKMAISMYKSSSK